MRRHRVATETKTRLGRTDICECRVAFATEKVYDFVVYGTQQFISLQQNWQCDPLY